MRSLVASVISRNGALSRPVGRVILPVVECTWSAGRLNFFGPVFFSLEFIAGKECLYIDGNVAKFFAAKECLTPGLCVIAEKLGGKHNLDLDNKLSVKN